MAAGEEGRKKSSSMGFKIRESESRCRRREKEVWL